mgnify:CR=1 FL=1
METARDAPRNGGVVSDGARGAPRKERVASDAARGAPRGSKSWNRAPRGVPRRRGRLFDAAEVKKILSHLGLRTEPLPRGRARDPTGQESFDFDFDVDVEAA